MQVILYGLLVVASIVILVMLYNRLYFEIHLAKATRILNKELKKAAKQQVDEFSKELKDTLNFTIDAMTETYDELAKTLTEMKQTKE